MFSSDWQPDEASLVEKCLNGAEKRRPKAQWYALHKGWMKRLVAFQASERGNAHERDVSLHPGPVDNRSLAHATIEGAMHEDVKQGVDFEFVSASVYRMLLHTYDDIIDSSTGARGPHFPRKVVNVGDASKPNYILEVHPLIIRLFDGHDTLTTTTGTSTDTDTSTGTSSVLKPFMRILAEPGTNPCDKSNTTNILSVTSSYIDNCCAPRGSLAASKPIGQESLIIDDSFHTSHIPDAKKGGGCLTDSADYPELVSLPTSEHNRPPALSLLSRLDKSSVRFYKAVKSVVFSEGDISVYGSGRRIVNRNVRSFEKNGRIWRHLPLDEHKLPAYIHTLYDDVTSTESTEAIQVMCEQSGKVTYSVDTGLVKSAKPGVPVGYLDLLLERKDSKLTLNKWIFEEEYWSWINTLRVGDVIDAKCTVSTASSTAAATTATTSTIGVRQRASSLGNQPSRWVEAFVTSVAFDTDVDYSSPLPYSSQPSVASIKVHYLGLEDEYDITIAKGDLRTNIQPLNFALNNTKNELASGFKKSDEELRWANWRFLCKVGDSIEVAVKERSGIVWRVGKIEKIGGEEDHDDGYGDDNSLDVEADNTPDSIDDFHTSSPTMAKDGFDEMDPGNENRGSELMEIDTNSLTPPRGSGLRAASKLSNSKSLPDAPKTTVTVMYTNEANIKKYVETDLYGELVCRIGMHTASSRNLVQDQLRKKTNTTNYTVSGSSYSSSYGSSCYTNRYSHRQGTPIVNGAVGLTNLGNTCFMASMLQCLSNTSLLRSFFISDAYKSDVNASNPLGFSGKIAKTYAELMKDMWSGTYTVCAPSDFKTTIGEFQSQFKGYNQQDSQEFMSFLLDGLHEDLNRILKKPYVESVEGGGRPDIEVAQESWSAFKLRNDSKLVDSCFGQLRSHVTCKCGHESVKFDEFSSLSLPIPKDGSKTYLVSCVPLDLKYPPIQLAVDLPLQATVKDLKTEIDTLLNCSKHRFGFVKGCTFDASQMWTTTNYTNYGRFMTEDSFLAVETKGRLNVLVYEGNAVTETLKTQKTQNDYSYNTYSYNKPSSYGPPVASAVAVPVVSSAVVSSGYTKPPNEPDSVGEFNLFGSNNNNEDEESFLPVPPVSVPDTYSNGDSVASDLGLNGTHYVPTATATATATVAYDTVPDLIEDRSTLVQPEEICILLEFAEVYQSPYMKSEGYDFTSTTSSIGPSRRVCVPTSWSCLEFATFIESIVCQLYKPTSHYSPLNASASASAPVMRNGSLESVDSGSGDEASSLQIPTSSAASLSKTYAIFTGESYKKVAMSDEADLSLWGSGLKQGNKIYVVFGSSKTHKMVDEIDISSIEPTAVDLSGEAKDTPFMDLEVASGAGISSPGSVSGSSHKRPARSRSGSMGGSSKELNITACLDKFSEREQLPDSETFYCSKCKEHLPPQKKIDLWSVPDVLIIHLKRFQYLPGATFIQREKIEDLIRFPIANLDISSFVKGPIDESAPPIYNLYAVSEHMGGLNGGHYTAKCLNADSDKWFDFNDSHVGEVDLQKIVSKSAYVLFYARASGPSSSSSTSSASVPAPMKMTKQQDKTSV